MVFLYFSGTGNSKYCIEYFAKGLGVRDSVYSIEQQEAAEQIKKNKNIVLAYPIYYSALPKLLKDYVESHAELWAGKNIFLIATMGAFSGDGTGVMARLLKHRQANITGGLHLVMPDCILDVKALKRTQEKNQELVRKARQKMDMAIELYQQGRFPREGLHWWNHVAGLFGQRLWFSGKTKHYTDKLKINRERCIGCGLCVEGCPMQNIYIEQKKAFSRDRCTMCYRCINNCPEQAITLIGKKVVAETFHNYE